MYYLGCALLKCAKLADVGFEGLPSKVSKMLKCASSFLTLTLQGSTLNTLISVTLIRKALIFAKLIFLNFVFILKNNVANNFQQYKFLLIPHHLHLY